MVDALRATFLDALRADEGTATPPLDPNAAARFATARSPTSSSTAERCAAVRHEVAPGLDG